MKQTKRATPYLGHNSAEFTHNNKFHRTSSEAYRDAEYASSIEGYDELADMKSFITGMFIATPVIVGFTYLVVYLITK